MTPKTIAQMLLDNEAELCQLFESRSVEFWNTQPEGKWKAGQHVIHLVQSTKPLLKALSMPSWIVKWKFGTNNRETRNFDQVVQKYKDGLVKANGIVSPFSTKMPHSTPEDAQKWLTKLSKLNQKINSKTLELSDKRLDNILLPHPLMGRMTLREILMWNAYHLKHHTDILKEKY